MRAPFPGVFSSDFLVRAAGGRGRHQLGVAAQERGLHVLFHRHEVLAAFLDFRFGNQQFQLAGGDVDVDGVAVLHEADEAAVGRFGGKLSETV